MSARTDRIVHCAYLTGGNPYGLSLAERALGYCSECCSVGRNPFGYASDKCFSGNKLLAKFRLLFYVLRRAKVIHYNNGASILASPMSDDVHGLCKHVKNLLNPVALLVELLAMKFLGKHIVVTYQGSDARPTTVSWMLCGGQSRFGAASFDARMADVARRVMILIFSAVAERIYYLNPDLAAYLPRNSVFKPYAHVDWRKVRECRTGNRRLRIVHAPTDRRVKGSAFVIEAIERLRSSGYEFDFTLVENMQYGDAMKAYEMADILVDQLMIGWYGGLAVELMAMGKCVVCYLRERDMVCIPEEMAKDIPICNATPDSVYNVLCNLLEHPDLVLEFGRKGREYAMKWHDPQTIAGSILKDLQCRT